MKPKSKNPTASSPKSAKKPTKTSKPACAKYARPTYPHNASEKPSDAPNAKEALASITNIQKALSVCYLLPKLEDSESKTVTIPDSLHDALVKLVAGLVEYAIAHVELDTYAKEALASITNIQKALSVCYLLPKLEDSESKTVTIPDSLHDALVKLVAGLVEYAIAHVELDTSDEDDDSDVDTCAICGCELEDNDDLEEDEYQDNDLCCECGEDLDDENEEENEE